MSWTKIALYGGAAVAAGVVGYFAWKYVTTVRKTSVLLAHYLLVLTAAT